MKLKKHQSALKHQKTGMKNRCKIIDRIVAVLCTIVACIFLINPMELHAADAAIMEEQGVGKENIEGLNVEETQGDQEESIKDLNTEEVAVDEKSENAFLQWNITEKKLLLQYDDRFILPELDEKWTVLSINTKEIYSRKVAFGRDTGESDSDIIVQDNKDKTKIIAVGVGKAEIFLVPKDKLEMAKAALRDTGGVGISGTIEAIRINVTVEPAPLTIIYVAGQSNAEGWCSANTGYRREESVCAW